MIAARHCLSGLAGFRLGFLPAVVSQINTGSVLFLQAPKTTTRDSELFVTRSATFSTVRFQQRWLSQGTDKNPTGQEKKNKFEDLWMTRYQELKEYKTKHGDCLVPRTYQDNPQLGPWVQRQRRKFKQIGTGTKAEMSQNQVDQLNELEFDWNPKETAWMTRYNELGEYAETHGNFSVPEICKSSPQLGIWVKTQRHQYSLWKRDGRSKITPERIELLERIKFEWQGRSPNVRGDEQSVSVEKTLTKEGAVDGKQLIEENVDSATEK